MPDQVDSILEQWSRERPDLDPSPMGIVGRISALAKRYHEALSGNLLQFGLTPDEFDVLATLRRSGRPYALRPRELIDSMMVRSATVTHRLDKLEARGLIVRGQDPDDRRSVLAALTPKGRRLIDRAVASHLDFEQGLLSDLLRSERQTLADLLRRLSG